MKTQESEEDLLSVALNNRSHSGESTKPIPFDIVVEIFLRLPAKSIARFSCVSKRMASILRLPYFADLFLTISLARPKLLFYFKKDSHVFLFSSPQPQSLDENSSVLAATSYHIKTPYKILFDISSSSIRGLVFLKIDPGLKVGRHGSVICDPSNDRALVICNPSTGQSLILPQVKSRRETGMQSYFGYDPIEKQYKVLSITWSWSTLCKEYQVLTLGGTGEPSWRKIKCPIPHSPSYEYHHICINGILYYPALHNSSRDYIIVCFDVRSEKFKVVKTTYHNCEPLINYNDKLASLHCHQRFYIHERRINIKLRVLEDAEKQEWSEHTYEWPALCNSFVGDSDLRVIGMTRTNEIVLSSSRHSMSYYVFYYNIERKTITRVDIQGMEEFKHCRVYTFLDHVENVKLMKVF